MSDPSPEIEGKMQRAAHDVYMLRHVIDDLWRDLNGSAASCEVLMVNWLELAKESARLKSLVERVLEHVNECGPEQGTGNPAGC